MSDHPIFPTLNPVRLVVFSQALDLLDQATAFATKARVKSWQFAVPVKPLFDGGLTEVDVTTGPNASNKNVSAIGAGGADGALNYEP